MRYLSILTKKAMGGSDYPNTLLTLAPGKSPNTTKIQFKNYPESAGTWSPAYSIPNSALSSLLEKYEVKGYDNSEDVSFLKEQSKKKPTWAYVSDVQQYADFLREAEEMSSTSNSAKRI